MTTKPKTRKALSKLAALAQAIARHKTAQAALDAVPGPEDYPVHLYDVEDEALHELALTTCASDAEFIEKLRYLYAHQARMWGPEDNANPQYGCLAMAAERHFRP
jgi:hypothetical protein